MLPSKEPQVNGFHSENEENELANSLTNNPKNGLNVHHKKTKEMSGQPPDFNIDDVVIKKEISQPNDDPVLNNNDDFGNVTVKTEVIHEANDTNNSIIIKTEPAASNSVVQEETTFNVGDFVWAQMGGYPYWPGMITLSEDTKEHVKHIYKKTLQTFYHVHYFGDKGRWNWIRVHSLLPFTDRYDFEKFKKFSIQERKFSKDKHLRACKVGFAILPKWLHALDELDSVKDMTLEERLNFFKELPKKLQENRNSLPVVKLEKYKPKGISSRASLPAKITPKLSSPTITKTRKQSLPLTIIKPEETSSVSSDNDINNIDLNETDPEEKFTLEDQRALFKKCNLFKGIIKEKVCQVCEKFENISKCKGPCGGYFHKECALIQLEELEIQLENNYSYKTKLNRKPEIQETNQNITYKTIEITLEQQQQLDNKLIEIVDKLMAESYYGESDDDSNYELAISKIEMPVNIPTKKFKNEIMHVTGDGVSFIRKTPNNNKIVFKCINCEDELDQLCFVCHKITYKGSSVRQRCSSTHCGKYFHLQCLKSWPQTQFSTTLSTKKQTEQFTTFVCPMHNCHTCISDDPRANTSRVASDKLIKCMRCPASYHQSSFCLPAGCEILTSTQMVCPKHVSDKVASAPTNTNWCHVCGEGGNIVCCETCPVSVHSSCVNLNLTEDGLFICEECDSCRFPIYNEVVWAKWSSYRWWPAQILFPAEIPDNVKYKPHKHGDFVVRFFGSNDFGWLSRGKVFLYQEGDCMVKKKGKGYRDLVYQDAIEDAEYIYQIKKEFQEAEKKSNDKPPVYIKIKTNKPVGNVRLYDGNLSNTNPCNCDPSEKSPCDLYSNCLNRLLMTECNPEICPAGKKCQNQNFEKRIYPPLEPCRTPGRGWGLKTLADLVKGQFIIEYVGELIDETEYQRRIRQMNENKEENYYFLTLDNQRMIDAGPKGNVARFMNHSCQPNAETQKWTVDGETRIGLFALDDIKANTELTFNYNLEVVGDKKKMCECGAPNCSGYIGLKKKQDEPSKKSLTKKIKLKKKKDSKEPVIISDPCFICGKNGETYHCQNKLCTKSYHLKCVNLNYWPDGKWMCPWHSCNICEKRTIRCCVQCTNSFCPQHSEGLVRYDKVLGFVCYQHDEIHCSKTEIPKITSKPPKKRWTMETDVTSTTEDSQSDIFDTSIDINLDHLPIREDVVSSSPMKKSPKKRKLSDIDRRESLRKKSKLI